MKVKCIKDLYDYTGSVLCFFRENEYEAYERQFEYIDQNNNVYAKVTYLCAIAKDGIEEVIGFAQPWNECERLNEYFQIISETK